MIYKVLHTIKLVKKHEFLKYCSKYLLFRFGTKGKCIFAA